MDTIDSNIYTAHATQTGTSWKYVYDASTLPTFLGPLARLYFLASTDLGAEERKQRAALFGSFRDGFRPNKPHSYSHVYPEAYVGRRWIALDATLAGPMGSVAPSLWRSICELRKDGMTCSPVTP